ncbi:MAG TPA: response regulator [Polyangiaceae bacterium]|nr:response regulator [Polyangiaceae bacterium]
MLQPGSRLRVRPWHILIVDNSPEKLALLTERLQDGGYVVSCCSSVSNLEAEMGALDPDVVLLDVLMPRLDAAELSRLLRAYPADSQLPIILHSPIASPTLRRLIETSGALGVIEATLDAAEFMAALGRFLDHLDVRDRLRVPPFSGTHRIGRLDGKRASSMPPRLRAGIGRGRS